MDIHSQKILILDFGSQTTQLIARRVREAKVYCEIHPFNWSLEKIREFKHRAEKTAVTGNREYNPGWHTALDLKNLLTVSEAITLAALERKESRGAQFRDDYPEKNERFAKVNTMSSKMADGSMKVRLEPLREMPDYLKQVIEEMK